MKNLAIDPKLRDDVLSLKEALSDLEKRFEAIEFLAGRCGYIGPAHMFNRLLRSWIEDVEKQS